MYSTTMPSWMRVGDTAFRGNKPATQNQTQPGQSGQLYSQLSQLLNQPSSGGTLANYFAGDPGGQPIRTDIGGGAYELSFSKPTAPMAEQLRGYAPRQELAGYTGPTSVNMSPETAAMLDQISGYSSGTLAQILSGQTNQGLFQRAVVDPAWREFEAKMLPGIRDTYTGGAYGAGYWSGARQNAEQQARGGLANQLAMARYQDYLASQDRALQAGQLLPQLAQAMAMRENLAAQNLERAMQVHYQNQGLKSQQFQDDMAFVNSLLGAQAAENQNRVSMRGQDIQQAAGLRGNLIDLLGLDLNREMGQLQANTSRSNAALAAMAGLQQAGMQASTAQRGQDLQAQLEAAKLMQQNQSLQQIMAMYGSQQPQRPGISPIGVIGSANTGPSFYETAQNYKTSPIPLSAYGSGAPVRKPTNSNQPAPYLM